MNKLSILILTVIISIINISCSEKSKEINGFVFVKGGAFINAKTNYSDKNVKMNDFYIGKYEVTQKEWTELMSDNPSKFIDKNNPVETVSWYDCIEYCNKRSVKEGLKPYYIIHKDQIDRNNNRPNDTLKWVVIINQGSKGYRLPMEVEWEYAASGGQQSKDYIYTGGNDLNSVAWFWKNSGKKPMQGIWTWANIEMNECQPQPIGKKKPNELGIYDMAGNVREFCWNWKNDGNDGKEFSGRICKGGGWFTDEIYCEIKYTGVYNPSANASDMGFRLCRSL